jgi:hypothetical protein
MRWIPLGIIALFFLVGCAPKEEGVATEPASPSTAKSPDGQEAAAGGDQLMLNPNYKGGK